MKLRLSIVRELPQGLKPTFFWAGDADGLKAVPFKA